MEMTLRLKRTIESFNESSDRWSRRLFWLTFVLALFTVVLIVIAVEQAYLVWIQLERMR
jgi:uncharacterized membrane protein